MMTKAVSLPKDSFSDSQDGLEVTAALNYPILPNASGISVVVLKQC